METVVNFVNPSSENLVGIVAKPDHSALTPVVIVCHGYSSSKGNALGRRATERLLPAGIATLRFDFSGHGESQGNIQDITLSKGVEDLHSAFNLVLSFPWADKSRIALLGSSFGGNVALLFAAKYNAVKALALRSPISNYAHVRELQLGREKMNIWKREGVVELNDRTRSKYRFYEDAKKINTYNEVKKINAPILVAQGNMDEDIPMSHTKELRDAIGNKGKVQIFPGANHSFKDPNQFEAMLKLLIDFLVAALR